MRKNNSREIMGLYDKYVARTYNTLPVVLRRADRLSLLNQCILNFASLCLEAEYRFMKRNEHRGVYVIDADGKKYLDFWAAYSALNLGHQHPAILAIVVRQLAQGSMFTRACYNNELALLGKDLSRLFGDDWGVNGFEDEENSSMILPKNSGAEGVETAIKTARMWAYRTGMAPHNEGEIIVAAGNFHGRTIAIISFSTELQYKDDFGPYVRGFRIIPYNSILDLKNAITPRTIAVLIEPIQGEGGIIIPSEDYLKQVRTVCDDWHILMMLDEIQTGLGRTGKMFCFEHSGIKPDVVILGKALGGGVLPISLIIGRRDIMELWKPGDDGSTFGGYSMACAVARKVLQILQRDKLPEKAALLGEYFMTKLKKINSPYIKEVRGKGLLIGIEFYPEAGGARKYCERLLDEGIICKEAHHHILRLSPPLVVTKEQILYAVEKIEKVLKR